MNENDNENDYIDMRSLTYCNIKFFLVVTGGYGIFALLSSAQVLFCPVKNEGNSIIL